MRRPVPDPGAVVAALAARVQHTEDALTVIRQDVAALGRGVTDVLAQLRHLSPTTDNPGPSPDGEPTGQPVGDPVGVLADLDQAEGQRDWFTVADPAVAAAWLAEAADWAGQVVAWQGLDLGDVPCWPLHPGVVADLLAMSAQRGQAYPQPDPTGVTEWLTRWQPAGLARIRTELADCRKDNAHRDATGLVDATGLTTPQGLADAATWWTTARHTPAPTYLGLPHLT